MEGPDTMIQTVRQPSFDPPVMQKLGKKQIKI